MISINQVRNTVLFFLEKENRGYIKPQAFNEYANMAQLDIFENLFFDYNTWVNRQNRRLTGSEYADIPKNLQEIIDTFSEYTTEANFIYDIALGYWSYTGNDHYRDENISLVNSQGKKVDIELVNKAEINMLVNSNMNAPTLTYPCYTKIATYYKIYPTIPVGYKLELFFIRKPKAPKWTFIEISGNPIYNASASDLQDFEIPQSLYPKLVNKILLYCGINLGEREIIEVTNNEEMKKEQQQKQI